MTKRERKEKCYMEALEKSVVSVEMILNQLKRIEENKGIIDECILSKDKTKAILDLELSLATLCILLRKMSENLFIKVTDELRRDMNSIIHSNRFEFHHEVIVYSQKGREEVDLQGLLDFCNRLINDKIHS